MGFLGALLKNVGSNVSTGAIDGVMDQVGTIVNAIIAGLGGIVVLYAIYLAYKFMSADSPDKRNNAKAQLIYAIIGVIAIFVVLILWNTVLLKQLTGSTGSASSKT
jgi:uncharacterized membrane-anchored protein